MNVSPPPREGARWFDTTERNRRAIVDAMIGRDAPPGLVAFVLRHVEVTQAERARDDARRRLAPEQRRRDIASGRRPALDWASAESLRDAA